jgi:hypothetical protein
MGTPVVEINGSIDLLPDWTLDEVSDAYESLPTSTYTLEVIKMTLKTVTPKSGPNANKPTHIIQASFLVADDPTYSGRRLEKSFWLDQGPTGLDARQLKVLARVTGVSQPAGVTLSEWASRYEELVPPARFRVPIEQIPDKKNPGATTERILLLKSEVA